MKRIERVGDDSHTANEEFLDDATMADQAHNRETKPGGLNS